MRRMPITPRRNQFLSRVEKWAGAGEPGGVAGGALVEAYAQIHPRKVHAEIKGKSLITGREKAAKSIPLNNTIAETL